MTTVSDFNLQKLNTKELSEILKGTIEFGGNAFVCGRRGIGKTFITRDAIKNCNMIEVPLNVASTERSDCSGFPRLLDANESEYIRYLLPIYYKQMAEGDRKCVLFLDEIDKADHSIVAPLLELVQFRTINGKPLKNLVATIMTGNLVSEGGTRPSLPLLDRSEKYMIQENPQHWLDWGAASGEIHSSIAAYIADNQGDLCGEVDPGDVYADESPRGWHNASKIIIFGEKNKWPHKMVTDKVAGCVGKKSGLKYRSYFEHYQVLLPIIEKIIKGERYNGFNNLEQSKQMVACMILCSRLSTAIDASAEVKNKDLPRMSRVIGEFLQTTDPEMALISVRSQLGLEKCISSDLSEEPVFDKLLKDLGKRINS